MPKYDKDTMQRAIALRIAGQKYTEIGRELGVPGRTIEKWFSVGSGRDFSKTFFKSIVGKLMSDGGPSALKVLKDAFEASELRVPLLDKAKLALRMFGTLANIQAALEGKGGKGGGDEGDGEPGSILFQQFVIQVPELADKAKRLYAEVIEGEQVAHPQNDDGHGQVKRPAVKRPRRLNAGTGEKGPVVPGA